jgi:hypothetical protein
MKQLGIGFHGYLNEHDRFSPGWVTVDSVDPAYYASAFGGNGSHNFVQFILPYIEQSNVIRGYDFKKPWNSTTVNPEVNASNYQLVSVNIPIFKCPAAPNAREGHFYTDYTVSDYISNTAWVSTQMPLPPGNELTDSFWVRRSGAAIHTYPGISPQECTDGLSTTFIVVEDVGRPDLYVYGQRRGNAYSQVWADPNNRVTVVVNPVYCVPGRQEHFNCNNNNEVYSFHLNSQAGIFLFGDGSVKLIKDSIAGATFRALYTRAGNEPIGDY